MTAADLARAAMPRLYALRRRVPLEDVAWVAARLLAEREREHPELARLPASARRAVWESWEDDLVMQTASRAAAL